MTHDQMIEAIQAHKRGEAIEFRRFGTEQWTPTCAPAWDFNRCDYRVKPGQKAPLERWAAWCQLSGGHEYLSEILYKSRDAVLDEVPPERLVRAVRMVEAGDEQ